MPRIQLKTKTDEKDDGEEKHAQQSQETDLLVSKIPIDKYDLDSEASAQPELTYKAGKLLTQAKDATLRAKNRMEIVEFEMIEDIKRNPQKYNLSKMTDTVVLKAAKTTEKYQKAFNTYLFVKRKEDDFALLVDNIRQRGFMIKTLAELWMNNYYSEPTVYKKKITRKNGIIKIKEEF